MKIHYTGRQMGLAPAQLEKIRAAFAKVGKLLDGREEKEAHVVLSTERHLNHIEVTVNYHNHRLVGLASSADLFTALNDAVERLEKQALKVRAKWREAKRTPRPGEEQVPVPEAAEEEVEAGPEGEEAETAPQVFRVNHQKRKPMTLDEALLEMEKNIDYLVYRDAVTDRVSVLVRRRDGNFDLVEA